jgi:hypothetical protein
MAVMWREKCEYDGFNSQICPKIRGTGEPETATIYLTLAVGVRWINIAREHGQGGELIGSKYVAVRIW